MDRELMDIELLTIGRVSVDLYAEQTNVSATDVETFRKSIGGTTTNVAVAAARLGCRSATMTRVGNDEFGQYVRHALANRFGVDTRYVGVDPEYRTPLAFVMLDPPEEPRVVFYREPKAPDMQMQAADVDPRVVADVPILWIAAGNLAYEPCRTAMVDILEIRAGKRHTVLDLDWRPMFWRSGAEAGEQIQPLLDRCSIVIGNRAECEVAVGTSDPDTAADRLLERGVEIAVIKLGADGVFVADTNGLRARVPAVPVQAVCGVGAGDAFGGALCFGLLRGWDVTSSVLAGSAAGAIVASRLMCADDMPTLAEVRDLLLQHGTTLPEPESFHS
jgi:5-dehydro-2-deoxygluconokinase